MPPEADWQFQNRYGSMEKTYEREIDAIPVASPVAAALCAFYVEQLACGARKS